MSSRSACLNSARTRTRRLDHSLPTVWGSQYSGTESFHLPYCAKLWRHRMERRGIISPRIFSHTQTHRTLCLAIFGGGWWAILQFNQSHLFICMLVDNYHGYLMRGTENTYCLATTAATKWIRIKIIMHITNIRFRSMAQAIDMTVPYNGHWMPANNRDRTVTSLSDGLRITANGNNFPATLKPPCML